jgi:hypothetical protein
VITRRRFVCFALCVSALAQVPAAAAGPYIDSASKTRARAGEVVRLRAGTGLQLEEPLPLYLVPEARAPRPYECKPNALCRPRVARAPHGGIYHRIGTLNTRRAKEVTITYRVPRLVPGRYVYVFYCDACHRGRGGSLITWSARPTLTVLD